MNSGRTIFSQLMEHAPWAEFQRCVQRHHGDRRVRSCSCREQFLAMTFAQLTYRESLRDVVACLNSQPKALYHMGFSGPIRRSTLSDANRERPWRLFADFGLSLIAEAQQLYAHEPLGAELQHAVSALDATVISLALGLFPWTRFRRHRSAIKLHACLDLATHIPTFVHLTKGLVSDLELLDHLPVQPGTIYVMDRGFTDFARLHRLHRQGAFFILRAKRRLAFRRRYSQPVDRATGLRCDQLAVLVNRQPRAHYPDPLRRISLWDAQQRTRLVMLTNHLGLPAQLVTEIYRRRWDIELFFRWIKQNLRIKTFMGTSYNAVSIQVWVAICTYVLMAIIRKRLHLDLDLYTMLQIISVSPFQKVPLAQLLTAQATEESATMCPNQLWLFDL
jgi:hypothetical protein